jgi:hypothetical protein
MSHIAIAGRLRSEKEKFHGLLGGSIAVEKGVS